METRDVVCPNCNAQPGHPCTVPTISGRKAVNWLHYGRIPRLEMDDE